MEAEPDGYRILPTLVRLLARARHDAQDDQFEACAMDTCQVGRQATRAPELHCAHPGRHSPQARGARTGSLAEAIEQGTLRRSGAAARYDIRYRALLNRNAAGRCYAHFSVIV